MKFSMVVLVLSMSLSAAAEFVAGPYPNSYIVDSQDFQKAYEFLLAREEIKNANQIIFGQQHNNLVIESFILGAEGSIKNTKTSFDCISNELQPERPLYVALNTNPKITKAEWLAMYREFGIYLSHILYHFGFSSEPTFDAKQNLYFGERIWSQHSLGLKVSGHEMNETDFLNLANEVYNSGNNATVKEYEAHFIRRQLVHIQTMDENFKNDSCKGMFSIVGASHVQTDAEIRLKAKNAGIDLSSYPTIVPISDGLRKLGYKPAVVSILDFETMSNKQNYSTNFNYTFFVK